MESDYITPIETDQLEATPTNRTSRIILIIGIVLLLLCCCCMIAVPAGWWVYMYGGDMLIDTFFSGFHNLII